ncbi:cytochrome c biogenesis protein ResB [Peredibacter sp. HCB2-198]|uniref:cytochrome c biogenesis protein ResB n=1 Tax=Peredibacter sp. HCB2-198 TaxID=3383025 RepID=UPI0038B51A42
MNTLVSYYRKVELFFGNLKFAVVIILLFAIALGYGTFMESYHGTEYANRLIYKSIWFMGIQFGMFLSILFATLIRLPMKKHLYGFYVIHAGLIILFLGSYVTYQSGVDGTVTLTPNLPARQVQVNQDELKIQFPSKGKEVTVDLPYVAGAKHLGYEYEGIKLGTFLPFAENKQDWLPAKIEDQTQTSSRYRLYNENFGEFITLSLHPQSDFSNTQQLGLLNVHYMPFNLSDCFSNNTPDGLIVWNGETTDCKSPTPAELKRRKNLAGKDVVEIDFKGEKVTFMPEMSPLPLNEKMELNENSPYRIFSKKLFEKNPHLFLFGKSAAYFDKTTSKWVSEKVEMNGEIPLPWMGFKLRLLEHRSDAYPTMVPSYVKPVQDNGQTIKGDLKAVEVQMDGHTFWVNSQEPIAYNKEGERVTFMVTKKTITLPYEIVLDNFKMDTDPGTNNPASYESFVTVFKGNEGSEKHHVYMNHPLKYQNFTFYQASYFQTQEGPFGSVLSVNFDPGRFWKYLGSLLLVLGSIWHYILRRKTVAKPGEARA